MHVQPSVFDDAEALGEAAAAHIADRIAAAGERQFLLGCPGGRSAASTYRALAREAARRQLDLSRVVIVMMDDYVVRSEQGELVREAATADHSCERFAREDIVAPLNAGLPEELRIPEQNLWMPDVTAPDQYDGRIQSAGGVDIFILASGASDGHVAFNPPGSDVTSGTRIVDLPDSTRRDNLATFPSFGGDLENVPRHGLTVGIGTIKAVSKSVLMLVHGADKGLAAARLSAADGYDPDWPATIFADCREPRLFLDTAAHTAASHLPSLTNQY
jgi:glucosamine-6-phosphate deaminase